MTPVFNAYSLSNSDGATLNAVSTLPNFHSLTCSIITYLYNIKLEDNPVFLEMLRDALLPFVGTEDEPYLNDCICHAIKPLRSTHVSVLEFLDALWLKATNTDSNDARRIKDLYVGMNDEMSETSDWNLIEAVIQTGISRHIKLILKLFNDVTNISRLDRFTKSKLLEWAISPSIATNEIPMLKYINSEHALFVKHWCDEREFFTSKIIRIFNCPLSKAKTTLTEETIVSKILKKMDDCVTTTRPCEKQTAVAWLLRQLCMAIEQTFPAAKFEPILTGSTAECTQAVYIDEFDCVILTASKFTFDQIRKMLTVVVKQMKEELYHPYFAIESMQLHVTRLYPCLCIVWVDEEFRSTPISIDLVPATALVKPVTLPHHNFLPVTREHKPAISSLIPCKLSPCLLSESRGRIIFSLVENGLIKSLPKYIVEGYRLAKAIRILQIIQPIVRQLIYLGVTHEITKIIRTYHLKTCVFYLTRYYECANGHIEENNVWKWAIAIFEKLRDFVIQGDVIEFFDTKRCVFRHNKMDYKIPECKHKVCDFTKPLPRFRCCRIRKARLMIVDQILRVLRNSQSRYHPKNMSFGKALSKAVHTSILKLI